ncbi:MAG: hydroxyacylglutathione hydrolase family protein [Candidatus Thermoplasmatota archaeon]|jgi:glyoxylase-like metal-dependent hydrolase (beta-lactamase superfamily II)|nr:hydroxyacylglutathione hydrolase family protein [Candidatus Thermoplasmatota archaeon]
MQIKQFKVGFDNFSYVIFCEYEKEALIVDPGYNATKILDFIKQKNLKLKYVAITHYHFDHSKDITSIKKLYPYVKIIASKLDGIKLNEKVDIFVTDGQKIRLGKITLQFILTPGHTPGGICILVDNKAILTGDTLFIGDCGRTDLPGGNINQMYKSLQEKIKPLNDKIIVYPGHDYGEKPFDTLGNQKKKNKTLLAENIIEFSKIP